MGKAYTADDVDILAQVIQHSWSGTEGRAGSQAYAEARAQLEREAAEREQVNEDNDDALEL